MKEHPDYKYRPRRKPKPLMKKEQKFGFPMSHIQHHHTNESTLSRSLMPPISGSGSSLMPSLMPDAEQLKLHHRNIFPSLPYIYPFRHPDEKLAEFALFNHFYPPSLANWPISGLANISAATTCNICPPPTSAAAVAAVASATSAFPSQRTPSPEPIKLPIRVIMKNDEFREGGGGVREHVIWKPLPVLPERMNLGTWWNDIASLATSSCVNNAVKEHAERNAKSPLVVEVNDTL